MPRVKWLDRPAADDPAPGALLKRLIADVSDATGRAPSLKDADIDELAEALRRVLAERGEIPAAPFRVVKLSARTLGELGAGDLARRLLVFGSGLVRPSVWEASGGGRIWILDLRRLTVDAGVQIELTVFRSLDAVIAAIVDVWDESSGLGRLGLRHVQGTAERLFGAADQARGRRSTAFAKELLLRSRARLQQLASERRWAHVPEVLSLD